MKEKLRHILEIKYKPDRKPLKEELKVWIKNQPVDFLLPYVDDITIEELGILVNCGIRKPSYNKAMERIKEYKDQAKQVSEDQPTAPPPSTEGKPSIDAEQGLSQFNQEEFEVVLDKSDDEELKAFGIMLNEVWTKRHPQASPDVT